jgi:hypothetical protein
MKMAQKSKMVEAKVWLERETLEDKKSKFRSSYPTEYHVRIMIQRPGVCLVIAREFIFMKKSEQTAHYNHLKQAFGL